MQIEVKPAAAEEAPILENLLELYIHDFSEFLSIELGVDGRFGYPDLARYWADDRRHPFLIWVDGQLAGFVLVKQETAWDVAEFFVVRAYRRRGIGAQAAHQIWRRFPGAWNIRVMASNRPAYRFWKQAVAAFAGAPVPPLQLEKDGRWWSVFSFESKRAGA